MPGPAPHPCVVPGCSALITRGRRCRQHAVTAEHARRNYDVRRWYRTARWTALRARVLRDQAYRCADCGQVVAALEVDHRVKHEGDPGPLLGSDERPGALSELPFTQDATRRVNEDGGGVEMLKGDTAGNRAGPT